MTQFWERHTLTSRTIGHLYDGDGNRVRITHPDDGEISESEYRSRQQARGAGGAIGGAIVLVGVATRGVGVPALVSWGLRALAIRAHQSAKIAWNAAWKAARFRSAGDVGKVIGWGTGREAALARTAQIDRAAVAAMRGQGGLTRNVAEKALKLYNAAVKVNKGDTVPAARADLMRAILKLVIRYEDYYITK